MTVTASAAIGRLRKSTQRQLSSSVSSPPIIGPNALPMPLTPRISPPARPARLAGSDLRRPCPTTAGQMSAPPIAIERPGGDEHRRRLRRAAHRREHREDRDADEEHPPPAEEVGEAAAGDDEHAEDERVGVDDPLHRADVGVQVALDLGERDRQRREVVGDDEDREGHRHERQDHLGVQPVRRHHIVLGGHPAGHPNGRSRRTARFPV